MNAADKTTTNYSTYVDKNLRTPPMNVIGKDINGVEIDSFRAPSGFQLERYVAERHPAKVIHFASIPTTNVNTISHEVIPSETIWNRNPAGVRVKTFSEMTSKAAMPNEPELIYEGLYDYAALLPKAKRAEMKNS